VKVTFELSEKCNAECPLCLRSQAQLGKHELLLKDIQHILPVNILDQIQHIHLGGNIGDPIAAKDCLKICQYLSKNKVKTWIETNGSLRNIKWWEDLGRAFNNETGSFVVFHIDGLEDTNHIYRQKTNFKKIIENAESYINQGAIAIWEFIPFRHNEHQVEEAKKMADAMGFDKFRIRRSNRYWKGPNDNYTFDNSYGEITTIMPPTQEKYLGSRLSKKKELEKYLDEN